MQGVSQNMTVGGYSCECHLPYHVFDIKAFLPKKIFYSLNFILKSILQEYDCYIIFFIILIDIKQLNKLWKKTF